jgi:GNAT superfamily N-acetyltransferase
MNREIPSDLVVREASGADLDLLKELWEGLYRHQVEHGMNVTVPADGFALWVKGLRPLLGRFARVWVAWVDGAPQGFLCARLRNQPPHFSGEPTGFISDVFVGDRLRSRGVGRRLLDEALGWFDSQGLGRVELQVIAGNPKARELYVQLGFEDELLQMVRMRRPARA